MRSPEGTYERTYPSGELFAHAVGYYFTDLGDAGLERFRNNTLSGHTESGFQTHPRPAAGQAAAGRRRGHARSTRSAQRVAVAALEGHRGSVVAIEPSTGAVRVMASAPSFDPNALSLAEHLHEALAHEGLGSPLVNRATQFGYAPGLHVQGRDGDRRDRLAASSHPPRLVSGRNGVLVSGVPLHNDNNESFGEITLTEALAKSVDTAWAQVAEHVGKPTLGRYMDRFGFNRKPKLDYPTDQMSSSGEYEGAQLLAPDRPARGRGAHGDRPGQAARHAAADGRGGGGRRQPRPADDAASDRTHRRPRRPHGGNDQAARAADGDEALHRRGGHRK